jgi:hypothetical protein
MGAVAISRGAGLIDGRPQLRRDAIGGAFAGTRSRAPRPGAGRSAASHDEPAGLRDFWPFAVGGVVALSAFAAMVATGLWLASKAVSLAVAAMAVAAMAGAS